MEWIREWLALLTQLATRRNGRTRTNGVSKRA
jgi:hypothetical protein